MGASDSSDGLIDLAALRLFFEKNIPFHGNLGVSVTRLERGSAEVYLPYQEMLTGNPNTPALHGGALATIADAAGGLVLLSHLRPKVQLATIDLRMDFLQPAMCSDLWCSARIVRLGAQVGFTSMQLFQEGERLVAEGRAAFSISRHRS